MYLAYYYKIAITYKTIFFPKIVVTIIMYQVLLFLFYSDRACIFSSWQSLITIVTIHYYQY